MRQYSTEGSPFTERTVFEPVELELMCRDELRKMQLLPSSPEPIQIEAFIAKRFGITPDYGEELPNGILGLTRFGQKGPTHVFVTKALGEDVSDVGRRRTSATLAHEAGHGLLHGHLFVLSSRPTPASAGAGGSGSIDTSESRILCRSANFGVPTYDWVESQANAMIGPLLMPQPLVAAVLRKDFSMSVPTARTGAIALERSVADAIAKKLADAFDVNPVVARLRLAGMGFSFPRT